MQWYRKNDQILILFLLGPSSSAYNALSWQRLVRCPWFIFSFPSCMKWDTFRHKGKSVEGQAHYLLWGFSTFSPGKGHILMMHVVMRDLLRGFSTFSAGKRPYSWCTLWWERGREQFLKKKDQASLYLIQSRGEEQLMEHKDIWGQIDCVEYY